MGAVFCWKNSVTGFIQWWQNRKASIKTESQIRLLDTCWKRRVFRRISPETHGILLQETSFWGGHVGSISTRFKYSLFGFAHEFALIRKLLATNAQFHSLSNGILFRGSHKAKNVSFKLENSLQAALHLCYVRLLQCSFSNCR